MSLVPKSRIDKVQYFETHVAPWAAHAAGLGLTAGDVATLAAKAAAARAAYADQRAAFNAARSATQAFNRAVTDLATFGAALLAQVKATAAAAPTPGDVFTLAQIPAPADPAPKPAPGTPSRFTVALREDGSLRLGWACRNPPGSTGTIYEVRRGLAEAGPFVHVGASGTRSFLDDTLPPGATGVTYEVTAVRSTKRGKPARFTVRFGVLPGTAAAVLGTAAVVADPRRAA